jgi:hypothetical protein
MVCFVCVTVFLLGSDLRAAPTNFSTSGITVDSLGLTMTQPQVIERKGEPSLRRFAENKHIQIWKYGTATAANGEKTDVEFRQVHNQWQVVSVTGNSLEVNGKLVCKLGENLGPALAKARQLGHSTEGDVDYSENMSKALRCFNIDARDRKITLYFLELKLTSVGIFSKEK